MRTWGIGLLAAFAFAAAGEARADWQQAQSRHFNIYADMSASDLRDYATKLERFDQAVRTARKMSDPPLTASNRLTIYVLPDVDDLRRVTDSRGTGLYGIYTARASGSYAFLTEKKSRSKTDLSSDIIFFHEYSHHLMLQNSAAAYPAWLIEGFAEFLSTAKIADDGAVTLGAAANHRSYGVFAINHDLTLSAMLGGTYRHLNGWQQELIYARGWLLTHYLTFEPSRRGQLDRYVAAIQQGQSAGDAARAIFGDLKTLDRDLNRYAAQKTLSGIVVQTDAAKIGNIAIRPLTPAEAAILPERIQTDYGVSRNNAPRVAGRASDIAAKFPNDAFVQASLAEAELDAHDYPAAIAAADRALAANPNSSRGLILKGRALMEIAKKQPTGADWNAIRALFARANRLDTENAEPLMLYYKSYTAQGVAATPNSVKGLLYAAVLAPQDDRLRLMAVRQLLADSRLAEARKAFAPLAFSPHAGSFHDTAEDIVAAIDASDGPKALALIDDWKRENDID